VSLNFILFLKQVKLISKEKRLLYRFAPGNGISIILFEKEAFSAYGKSSLTKKNGELKSR